jgi:phosphocarrier protein FPr/phosphocarrier protein
MSSADIILVAPLSGWLTPLEEVPDPVFAERMMGEGVAIDPTSSSLCAPADATVIAVSETAHAVTMRLDNDAELLIHVGLETVALGGAGLRPLCAAGARVKAGDPLIELDLDLIARRAKSLVTPIILASEGYTFLVDQLSRPVSYGDPIAKVSAGRKPAAGSQVTAGSHERTVTIGAAHGLHARPAARIAALLRPFSAEVSLVARERSASARSVVAMLGLGLRSGDEARIIGRGAQSQEAVEKVAALIEGGLGEPETAAGVPVSGNEGAPLCASPGLAIGEVFQLRLADLPVPADGAGIAEERDQLASALAAALASMHETGVAAELAAAHRALLEDPDLAAHANREIAKGRSAAFAWRSACEAAREQIRATGDAFLIERAADLTDIERRVIATILGDGSSPALDLPTAAILVAPDLYPSQFLALDKSRLRGICTAEGGPTSHVAILAASAGVPMIVNAGPAVLDIAGGTSAILDADHARIEADPASARMSEVEEAVAAREARRQAEAREASEPCFTADGTRIEVFANLGSIEDAHAAVAAGAEGCGLLRTEFLFLDRDLAPSEEEQGQVYSSIAKALGGRPLVVRTLDIGADKSVPYVALGREENPALGLRGVRLSLARPDLFLAQLKAIANSVPREQCRIMLPMITEVEELRQARGLLDGVSKSLGLTERIALGVMIETPAAAMLARSIAAEADFFSVGTNDLTQYALAADRGNAAVAGLADALHPAVLRLIRNAAEGAHEHGRWIGVCGGLASDPVAAAILIGLGVTELSVAPVAVPAIKAAVRRLDIKDCRLVAERACGAASAAEVRAMAIEAFE